MNNTTEKTATKACWNEIGIWSPHKATCPKLEAAVHCRNCPVFIQEGRTLFERSPPSEYILEWTTLLAKEKENIHNKGDCFSLLVFRIENEWFGLPPTYFKEIVESRPVQFIPHRSNDILLGMVNIQGQLQLCVSLKGLLHIDGGKVDRAVHTYVRIAVVEKDGEIWSFYTDEIAGVEKFSIQEVSEPAIQSDKATYLKGVIQWKHPQQGTIYIGVLNVESFFEGIAKKIL